MNHLDQPRAADPRRRLIPWVGNPAFNYGNPSLSAPWLRSLIVPANASPTELNGAELEINVCLSPRSFFLFSTVERNEGEEKGFFEISMDYRNETI